MVAVRLRLVAIGGLATLAPALAGCGGGGPSAKTLTKAATKTSQTANYAASYAATLAISSLKGTIAFKGKGVVDNSSHHSRVSLDLASLAAEAGSKGDPGAFRGVEVVDSTADIVVYLQVPFYTRQLPPKKSWLQIDYGKRLLDRGIAITTLTLNQDPAQYLEFLQGVSGKVKKLGEEEVGGVKTSHFAGTIDIFSYPKAVTGARHNVAQHIADRLVQLTKDSAFPTEVWVDKDGYVRRLIFVYAIPASDTAPKIDYKLTLGYSGFGGQASVGLPPFQLVAPTSALKPRQ